MSPERLCWPPGQWPAADRQLWEAGVAAGELFAPCGVGAHWAAQSQRKFRHGYGRWLSWLAATDQLDPDQPAGARVTPARVAAYVAALSASSAPYSCAGRLQDLSAVLRLVAPEHDWGWLQALGGRCGHARSRCATSGGGCARRRSWWRSVNS
jgi:hypothetical protein